MSSKLIPAKHVSIVQKDKVIFTYAIVSGFKFIVVTVIENSISEAIYGKDLTHPSLIIELCLLDDVEISFSKQKKIHPSKPTIKASTERKEEENAEEAELEDLESEK